VSACRHLRVYAPCLSRFEAKWVRRRRSTVTDATEQGLPAAGWPEGSNLNSNSLWGQIPLDFKIVICNPICIYSPSCAEAETTSANGEICDRDAAYDGAGLVSKTDMSFGASFRNGSSSSGDEIDSEAKGVQSEAAPPLPPQVPRCDVSFSHYTSIPLCRCLPLALDTRSL